MLKKGALTVRGSLVFGNRCQHVRNSAVVDRRRGCEAGPQVTVRRSGGDIGKRNRFSANVSALADYFVQQTNDGSVRELRVHRHSAVLRIIIAQDNCLAPGFRQTCLRSRPAGLVKTRRQPDHARDRGKHSVGRGPQNGKGARRSFRQQIP